MSDDEKRSGTVLIGAAGVLAVIGVSELLNTKYCKQEVYKTEANCSSSSSGGSSAGGHAYGGGSGSSESSTSRGGFGSSGHSFFGGS